MTHLVIQQKKVSEGGTREVVSSDIIERLYNAARSAGLISQTTDVKGDLLVDKTYKMYVDFLALLNDSSNPSGKYRDLDILVTSLYIYFGDAAVESYWANTAYGDGTGITLASAATITLITNSPFLGNTDIVSLDGMLYFIGTTTITNSFAKDATNLVSFSCPLNLLILSECNLDGAFHGAFRGCTSLTNVTLNEGLQKIANRAFMGCTSLLSIDIPSSVTHLSLDETTSTNNYGVFQGCSSLTTITGGEGIVWIGSGAFSGTNVSSFPDFQFSNIRGIGDNAFWELPISIEVDLPSLTYLGQSVFKGTNITKVKCLGSITEIKSNGWWSLGCFALCPYLTEVDLSTTTNLTTIGYAVFLGDTALRTVTLPSSLTTINESAFFGCSALQSIDLSSCTTLQGSAFNSCTSLSSVTLGNNLTTLLLGTFKGCTSLTSIDLSHISTIGNSADYDSGAFLNCTGLQTATGLSSVGYIGPQTFKGCSNLGTGLDLVLNLTANGAAEAFQGTAFRSVTVNGLNCTKIGEFTSANAMFYNMPNCAILDFSNTKVQKAGYFGPVRTNLKTIVYPDTLNYIGWQAWDYNSTSEALEHFIILATTPPSYENVTYCKIKNGNFYVPDSAVNDYKSAWPQTSGTLSWDIHAHIKPLSELPVGVWKTGLYQSYEPYLSNSSDPAYA